MSKSEQKRIAAQRGKMNKKDSDRQRIHRCVICGKIWKSYKESVQCDKDCALRAKIRKEKDNGR